MDNNLIEDRRVYPLGRVRSDEVELQVLSGSLAVTGGADEFCEALFEYSHSELRPLDAYDADGDEARLEIRQPQTHGLRNSRSRWQLAFNSGVTTSMAVESMSGAVDMNLDRMLLSDLELKSRSGRVRASLGGDYPDLGEVIIDSTSGRVAANLSGSFPALSEVDIQTKSGTTDLAITGACPVLRRVAVDALSGAVNLDLRGSFQREDLGVRIESKSGAVRIRLPEDVGASLNATTLSGRVRAEGFGAGSGRWTNAAFERSPVTIWLNIRVMSGNVEIVTG